MIFTAYPIGTYKIEDAASVKYNIRKTASVVSPIIAQVRGGDFLKIVVNGYSQESGYIWQQVKIGGVVGYAAVSLMRLVKNDTTVVSAIVTGSPTNIRSMPDIRGQVIGSVSRNGTFADIDPHASPNSEGINWYMMMGDSDKVEWAQADYIKYMLISPKTLDVEHFTQIGNQVHNDCGQASVKMLSDFFYKGQKELPSIDQMALATNTANKLTSSEDLVRIGTYCGVKLERVYNYNFIDFAHVIDAESPLIVLVRYGEFKPAPYHYSGGHWMVIKGYNEKGFIVNDPLQIEGDWHVPTIQLDRALQGVNLRLAKV